MPHRCLDDQTAAWAQTMLHFERPQELGHYLRGERERLIARLAPGFDGIAWCETMSALMDCAVERLFDLSVFQARAESARFELADAEVAVVATGGYGRSELSPYSDIDLTFVPARDGEPFLDAIVRHMFRSVMDIVMTRAGVKVGYAYRLVEDCAQLDYRTRTGLVDMRFVAGSRAQFGRFSQRFWSVFNATDFIFEKVFEFNARRASPGDSPLRAEPNLKEGAGGIRDFHTARWMAHVAYQAPIYRMWRRLAEDGTIAASEIGSIQSAFEFLTRTRNHLHALTGEPRDVVVRTRQESVALAMGYEGRPGHSPAEPFMSELYRSGLTLHNISKQIVAFLGNSRFVLGVGFDSQNGEIVPANQFAQKEAPIWILWAYKLAQQYRLRFSNAIQNLIRETLSHAIQPTSLPTISAGDDADYGALLMDILSRRGDVHQTLRAMADSGALAWALPEFGAIQMLIPYDSSHEFSVGEHTIRVIGFLDEVSKAEDPELRELQEILAGLSHPETLYLASLLHDSGKTVPNRPHSDVGEEIVNEVARRWRLSEKVQSDTAWLVKNHLLMAETARQRDLTLEHTIAEFVKIVDDVERLQMLYHLTYADTNAVGERIWTPVQAHFMKELYHRALHALTTEETASPNIGGFRRRLLRRLASQEADESVVAAHIDNMPPRYLFNTSSEQMALHIEYIERAKNGEPVVDFLQPARSAHTELTVVTLDDPRPGLLSKIAGALYAADIDVHGATVFTRDDAVRVALDTLWIDYRGRQLTPAKCSEVKGFLLDVLTGAVLVEELLAKRGKAPTGSEPILTLRMQPAAIPFTVLDLQARIDRGSLYRLAHAISEIGCHIHSAKLGVWAGRTVISFYLTDSAGEPLGEELLNEIHTAIPVEDRSVAFPGEGSPR